MICFNVIRIQCGKLVGIAFARSITFGQNNSVICTNTRALHKLPKIKVDDSRVKREDITHTKYEDLFCNWKLLVGPQDWKDYSMRKEGAERYRAHNLPDCTTSRAGVYEFGATKLLYPDNNGRVLDPRSIFPFYVGETKALRTRIQGYGRNGAHLATLFSDLFSEGLGIVHRWALMDSKEAAQEIEAELLKTYDYAGNKIRNGERRYDDIRTKLDVLTYINTSQFSEISHE